MRKFSFDELSASEQSDQVFLALSNELADAAAVKDSGRPGSRERYEKAVSAKSAWESTGSHPDAIAAKAKAKEYGCGLLDAQGGDESGDFIDALLGE